MWYHPAAFFLTKRDVIGAWLICVAVATAFFGYPVVTTASDIWAGNRDTTTACPEPVNWLASYDALVTSSGAKCCRSTPLEPPAP
jgi:hypothetical protein